MKTRSLLTIIAILFMSLGLSTAVSILDAQEWLINNRKNGLGEIRRYSLDGTSHTVVVEANKKDNGGLDTPMGMGVLDDAFFVADRNNNSVLRFEINRGGRFTFKEKLDFPSNGEVPHDILTTVDEVFVSGIKNDAVFRVMPSHGLFWQDVLVRSFFDVTPEPRPEPNTLDGPNGLAIRSDINGRQLFVAGGGSDAVYVFNADTGQFIRKIRPTNMTLRWPHGIVFHPNGSLLISSRADNCVYAVDLATDTASHFVAPGVGPGPLGGLEFPYGLAIEGDSLYVVDHREGNTFERGRVVKYSLTNVATSEVVIDGLSEPTDIVLIQ